jgi:hypothetical protein
MKINRYLKTALLALGGLALASSLAMAQPTNVFLGPSGTDDPVGASGSGNQLNVQMGVSSWQNWFINSPDPLTYTLSFDTNNPPPSGDTFGSVLQTSTWDGLTSGNIATFVCVDNNFWGGNTVDMTQYKSIDFDFKYDTNSTIAPTNGAQFNVMCDTGPDADSTGLTITNIANKGTQASNFNGGWHHISVPLASTITATKSKGPGFQMFSPTGFPGSFNYWVANLELVARTVKIPPPTVSTEPVITGLYQFADATPNYNRQDVRTTNDNADFNVDWVGQTKPVTYSWTIGSFPGTNAAGYAADVTFTPDPASSITYADPDWSSTNALFLTIAENTNGTATASLEWKTNQPAGGSSYVVLITNSITNGFTVPSAVGTWSLTFTSDTAMTLTAPNGAHTNVVLPANIAAMYTNISFFLNTTMNDSGNVGNFTVYTGLNITGVQTPVHETFNGGLNTPFLELTSQGYGNGSQANPPNQIFATKTNDAFWLIWNLPDGGFASVARPSLSSGGWTNLNLTPLLNGGERWTLIANSNLPSANESFFTLVKRTFSQLQVLLPGETNAPGTLTGKTGTPSVESTQAVTPVTVNAVDSQFNIIPGITDTIQITSSDTAAITPNNANLINGTGTFQILFQTDETDTTVTATDVTPASSAIPAATSSQVVVAN